MTKIDFLILFAVGFYIGGIIHSIYEKWKRKK